MVACIAGLSLLLKKLNGYISYGYKTGNIFLLPEVVCYKWTISDNIESNNEIITFNGKAFINLVIHLS